MSVREQMIEMLNPILGADYCPAVIGGIVDMMISRGVTINRWIPVSERLPKDDEGVMIFASGYMEFGWYDTDDLVWKTDEYAYDADEVTHWLPLPEPPKEDDHGLG